MIIEWAMVANWAFFGLMSLFMVDFSPLFGNDETTEDEDTATAPDPEVTDPDTPDIMDTSYREESYIADDYSQEIIGTEDADAFDHSDDTDPKAIFGFLGNDQLSGTGLSDHIEGGEGDDWINTNAGDDYGYGGDGNDSLYGLGGNDSLAGGLGNDFVEGNNGDDALVGNEGNDTIAGGGGVDNIWAGEGDDLISTDRLDAAADFTRGQGEAVNAQGGNDTIFASLQDVISTGEGADDVSLISHTATPDGPTVITDFDTTQDTLTLYMSLETDEDGAFIQPDVGRSINADQNYTGIVVDGQEYVQLQNVVASQEFDIEVRDLSELVMPIPAT